MHLPGFELAILRSRVRRPTTTLPSQIVATVQFQRTVHCYVMLRVTSVKLEDRTFHVNRKMEMMKQQIDELNKERAGYKAGSFFLSLISSNDSPGAGHFGHKTLRHRDTSALQKPKFKTNHRWSCVSSELSWVEVSRLFLDHGTRVEVSRVSSLVPRFWCRSVLR